MTKMSVALAFLLALCTLIYNVHGGGKGFKAKGSELKKTLVHKIFHHNHHHHYHHHYTHHPHPHHQYHHHNQYHHHPHHHHHRDGKYKPLNHHRHRHHHYHNPFKHHLHRHHHPHKKTFHRHPHKRPFHQHHHPHKQHQLLHQYHRLHKQHIQKHHKDVEHQHSNKRSGITHAPVPNKLQLHVRINSSQATKRQSLPDLLANLGQHLVKLGSSLTPKTSYMTVHGNTDNEGDVRDEVPEAKSPTVQGPTVQDSPVTVPAVSPKKNVSVNEVEGLLHHALDAENSDEMESAFSENGSTEASDAVTAAAGYKTSADRRNETFPEAEIYGRPLDDREYDASERQRESAYGTLKEIAGQSFETENTHQLGQIRNGQSNPGKENKPAVHDHDHSKNVEPTTNVDDVDTNTVLEHEKRKENSTQNDSPKLKTQSSSKEPKSSDMNSTLEDEGREIDKDKSKSGPDESQKSVTGESDAQNITDDEGKKTEVSGSGEDSFDDGNTEEQTATDNKGSYESKSAEQAPSKPTQDEEVNLAEESIDQNTIGSAEGQQVRERKSKPFINQTEDSLDEPTNPVSEGNIDQQAVVNVAENRIMGNQSDDSFQPDSTEEDLKMEGSNLENNKLINPPDSNDPEKTVSLDRRIKGSSIQDAKLRGDLDTQAIQHSFSGPENSIPTTNSEKVLQTKNGGPSTQLDPIAGNSNQSNEKDHPALKDIDKASGASNVGQESPQENEETQDQDSHTDIIGFVEGPKTAPAVLDEPAEPSSPSDADPQVVNVESPQEGNLQEDTSQEAYPGDVADAIPVYTLSSPVGDDTFRGDESSLSTPTSSVTTSSSNFIDTGGNMSTGYSESPSSSEGYGTFTAPVSQSQEDFGSLSQGAVVQRDMLDDPVQESLETNVDSKSS